MKRFLQLVFAFLIFVCIIGFVCTKHHLDVIQAEQNGIIHNIERDQELDKEYNRFDLYCKISIVTGLFCGICLIVTFIPRKGRSTHVLELADQGKETEQSEHPKKAVQQKVDQIEPTELTEQVELTDGVNQPALNRTRLGRRPKQKVTIAEDFKDIFCPNFIDYDDNQLRKKAFDHLKETLESQEWRITDIGKIANICYDSKAHNPKYTNFTDWFIAFCKAINRTDCPNSPSKSSYFYAWAEYPANNLRCIDRFREKVEGKR